jgi:hypothetical protein
MMPQKPYIAAKDTQSVSLINRKDTHRGTWIFAIFFSINRNRHRSYLSGLVLSVERISMYKVLRNICVT